MNFTDLFVVIALATALHGLVVAVTGRRQFLAKAVNPHRGAWVVAAASVLWVGVSLLRWEAQSWDPPTWGRLLAQLVTDTPTPPRVKVASMAVLLSGVFFGLVIWCRLTLPRDPSTFRRPEDRRAAFRYYVTTLRGGLDYALLAYGDGDRLEEAVDARQVQARCPHLPKVQFAEGEPPRARTADDQVQAWREQAQRIHERMGELDGLIEPAHHGRNRRLVFDAEFGGMFFKYLRLSDPRSKVDTGLYLFGATLNQVEMNSRRADSHFHLLLEALEHIDRSIRVA
jgi:hypothetical protein